MEHLSKPILVSTQEMTEKEEALGEAELNTQFVSEGKPCVLASTALTHCSCLRPKILQVPLKATPCKAPKTL